jgi:uncharacterized 2Fe-2S/4Fe-4S cluster protein (DUF4445 family)
MSSEQVKITFLPGNVETSVLKGTNLLTAAIAAGVHVNASCGGLGVCGTCKIKLESGTLESELSDQLSSKEYAAGIRLACQSQVNSDLVVSIPTESRLDSAIRAQERKKSAGISATRWKYNPPVKKYYLELKAASKEDNSSDLFRVLSGLEEHYKLKNLPADFEVIRKLSTVIREKDWKVTVTTLMEPARPRTQAQSHTRIINVEAGDTREKHYALAVDIGTTTVCSQLLDLNRGQIAADAIVFNKQRTYGDDVIARIVYSQKPGGLKTLQELVVVSINETIDQLLAESKVDRKEINYIAVAGNTTMQKIALGVDPKYIRLTPYTTTANFMPLVKANSLGINVAEHVYLYTFPSVSSYIGGDIVSGIISAGVHQRKKLTFYMDIGTNGEIVIGNSDWMVTASCSAGPAFEGAGIKNGMVAMKGAIQEFAIDRNTLEPTIKTIGGDKPRGICGSGLINIIADLLMAGVIDQNGKFNTTLISRRIRQSDDGYEYVVAWAPETQIEKDIVITEVDIDNLIRAKAAMYAGCHTLTGSVNTTCEDFEQVILAGNFGSSLDIEKAITIGLLPDVPRDRFAFIGNGSLSGARLVCYSTDMLNAARKTALMMTNIELGDNPSFNNHYIAALFLPHTDEKAFPTVSEKICLLKKPADSEKCAPIKRPKA